MNITKPFLIFTFVISFFSLIMAGVNAQTKEDDKVQSLGDILNPQEDDDGLSKVKNAKDMANVYYKKCMKEKSLAFDKDEKEILCACTSAKIGSVITVKEFKHLYEDSYKGKDIRGKVIAYAYTDCMGYVIKDKLLKDCKVSPTVKKIVTGKNAVCKCAVNNYKITVDKSTAYIIMQAIKYDPMTLNPLEHYFTTNDYGYLFEKNVENCYSRMLYDKYN